MFKRVRLRLHRLTFLCKVGMILSDCGKVFDSEWTRSVHRRFWTSPRWIVQLALNRATKDPDHWGAATALVRIMLEEQQ